MYCRLAEANLKKECRLLAFQKHTRVCVYAVVRSNGAEKPKPLFQRSIIKDFVPNCVQKPQEDYKNLKDKLSSISNALPSHLPWWRIRQNGGDVKSPQDPLLLSKIAIDKLSTVRCDAKINWSFYQRISPLWCWFSSHVLYQFGPDVPTNKVASNTDVLDHAQATYVRLPRDKTEIYFLHDFKQPL